jgi:Alpha/beta hydrolase of unknown function (DUF900)
METALQIHTYTISNRNGNRINPDILYLSNDNLPAQLYNENAPQSSLTPAIWVSRLAADLFAVCGNRPVVVPLVFHIHGFNTTATEARLGHAQYGAVLAAQGLSPGLVVSVSWPSNTALPKDGRRNAENSYALLQAVLTAFDQVQASLRTQYGDKAPTLRKVVTCHSMGNYLMSSTLASNKVINYSGKLDRVIMLAPDVDERIFTEGSEVLNQGRAIYDMASSHVQVVWSRNDAILEFDQFLGQWYVLGCRGPKSPVASSTPNVNFYDCTNVVAIVNSSRYVPAEYEGPPNGITHSACRFIFSLVAQQVAFITAPAGT